MTSTSIDAVEITGVFDEDYVEMGSNDWVIGSALMDYAP